MNKAALKKLTYQTCISKTGYRALFLLRLLLDSPKTRAEIIDAFLKNPLIAKDLSKDTVTNTANTLRKAGCVISRPNMRTNYRYILKSHPFSVRISPVQVKYLQELRKSIISFEDWELIESLNSFYSKLSRFVHEDNAQKELLFDRPFININNKILEDMTRFAKLKCTVKIRYNSPKNGLEDLKFIPDFIQFENDKLYVWGYSYKHKNLGYLRMDRIKSASPAKNSNNTNILKDYNEKIPKVKYRLTGYSAHMFYETKLDKIICRSNDSCVIETKVYSEFNMMQKLLSYGADCKILSPETFKMKFVHTLKNIKEGYSDD